MAQPLPPQQQLPPPPVIGPGTVPCTICRGQRWLPVEAPGGPTWTWCQFCHGTGTNVWYVENRDRDFRRKVLHRQIWFWYCVLWWPVYLGLVALSLSPLIPGTTFFYVLASFFLWGSILQIGMSIHLFNTRSKTPWAQDGVSAAVLAGGAIWLAHNNRRRRRY